MEGLTRIHEWLSAGALAHGISEDEMLKIVEEARTAIHEGKLRCWNRNGMPSHGGVPLEKQRRVDPHITDEAGNQWLKANGYLWSWSHGSARLTRQPFAVKEKAPAAWIALARQRAVELIKERMDRDLYPNQNVIADQIAKEFRKDGIHGKSGKPLKGEYIKRHAITGTFSSKPPRQPTATVKGK